MVKGEDEEEKGDSDDEARYEGGRKKSVAKRPSSVGAPHPG